MGGYLFTNIQIFSIFSVISQYYSVKRLFLLILEYENFDYTIRCMKYSKFCSIFWNPGIENFQNLLTGEGVRNKRLLVEIYSKKR